MPTSSQTPPRLPARTGPGRPLSRAWDLFRRHSGELFRFFGVGGTAYLIDIGLFNLCLLVLEWPDWISKIIATAIATTCAFVGNRHWTWRDRIGSAAVHRQYVLYFFFNGIGLLIALGCLWANNGLAQVWPEHFDNPLAKNIAANIIGVGIASAFRFYAYRTWVFRQHKEA